MRLELLKSTENSLLYYKVPHIYSTARLNFRPQMVSKSLVIKEKAAKT